MVLAILQYLQYRKSLKESEGEFIYLKHIWGGTGGGGYDPFKTVKNV